jgi:hypothetical protein
MSRLGIAGINRVIKSEKMVTKKVLSTDKREILSVFGL